MLSENCHIHATLSATAGRGALGRTQTNPEVVHCSIVGEESKRGARSYRWTPTNQTSGRAGRDSAALG
jgi:hypothetical protein